MDKESQNKKSMITQTAPGFLASVAVLFLLLVYAPVAIYATNVDGFSYDIYDLLKVMVPLYFAALVMVFIILLGLTKISCKIVNIIAIAMVGILVALYIQGTFLAGNLPPLDGRSIDWTDFDSQRLPSVLVWAGSFAVSAAAAVILKSEKFGRIVKYVSLFLIIMLLISAVLVAVPGDGLADKDNMIVTDNHMLDMSADGCNLAVLVLDYAGGVESAKIFEENPEYAEEFRDFTFFSDTVGGYSYTQYVIPLIFSGKWYENQESFYSFRERAYEQSKLFHLLEEQGYTMGLYEEEVPVSGAVASRFDNTEVAEADHFASPTEFVKTQFKLVGLKYAPYDLKRFCMISPELIYENSLKQMNETDLFDWSDRVFHEKVTTDSVVVTDVPSFRFIHISGAHEPFIYDGDVNVIPESEGSYESNLRAALRCAEEYLELLRESGVYDNSAIVIMGDHAYYWETRERPLLMIKPAGESHPFESEDRPVSFGDLSDAFITLSEGGTCDEILPARPERRFMMYPYGREDEMREIIYFNES